MGKLSVANQVGPIWGRTRIYDTDVWTNLIRPMITEISGGVFDNLNVVLEVIFPRQAKGQSSGNYFDTDRGRFGIARTLLTKQQVRRF